VIGPNGSGKSTLAKVLAGLIPPRGGGIFLGGRDVTGVPAWKRPAAGLAYVPQELNIFPNMTVAENFRIASQYAGTANRADFEAGQERALALFPKFGEKQSLRAGLLSGGERQLLAFACAMIASPRILVLDEPSAGLSPRLVARIMEVVTAIHSTGTAIFMIEQNVTAALKIAKRVVVLVNGQTRLTAAAQDFGTKYNLKDLYFA
jgi:branched-chain amino acid transport system ATP-binding protein/neutral amino acid transport system ATP-binding protein